jgi:hypothetical protein
MFSSVRRCTSYTMSSFLFFPRQLRNTVSPLYSHLPLPANPLTICSTYKHRVLGSHVSKDLAGWLSDGNRFAVCQHLSGRPDMILPLLLSISRLIARIKRYDGAPAVNLLVRCTGDWYGIQYHTHIDTDVVGLYVAGSRCARSRELVSRYRLFMWGRQVC